VVDVYVQLNTTVIMVDTTPFSQESATGVGKTSDVSTLTCVNNINQVMLLLLSCFPSALVEDRGAKNKLA